MRVYYFGCWDEQKGHFFHHPDGRRDYEREGKHKLMPWAAVDGCLCPGYRGPYENGPQVEGEAALHHKEAWTALAFWDRSMDSRGGCNSVFFAEGTYNTAEMIKIAKEKFPSIWARFSFEVRVVSRPNDVANIQKTCSVCGRPGISAIVIGSAWAHDPPGWFRLEDKFACSVECVTKAGG